MNRDETQEKTYRLVCQGALGTLKTRKMSAPKTEMSLSYLPTKLFSSYDERTTCSFREKERSEK